ncbi:hypothetical protein PAMA_014270 [Pampus argenteus]
MSKKVKCRKTDRPEVGPDQPSDSSESPIHTGRDEEPDPSNRAVLAAITALRDEVTRIKNDICTSIDARIQIIYTELKEELVVMGFREAALLGFVLLLSGVNVCAASQNTTDVTLNPTPPEQSFPVSYRLRSYRLREPAVKQKPLRPLGDLTSEIPEPQKLLQGPNLNPTVKHKSKVLVKFEQRVPARADSVDVHCGEREVTVEVRQNFLGNGQLIRPSDLTLGGCAALHAADRTLRFQTELQGCGGTVRMTEEALIYTFSLTYSPTPIGITFILKTNPAEVEIECHYQRKYFVSSSAVRPTWEPSASNVLAEQQLGFSLRLATEDWQSQRPSSVYSLSDVMHIEASVLQGHHVPMRVYADSCVATVNPDPNSQPRYPFITNHGRVYLNGPLKRQCLTDAKLTGAKSYFMQRSREDQLRFQLKAFRFHRDHRNSLYITCHLKATTLSVPVDPQRKACSFLTEANRWVASGGDNKVCSCCETSCSEQRLKRSLAADTVVQWEGAAALGPILLEENILHNELTELFPPDPSSLRHTFEVTRAASYPSLGLLCGVGAALAVVLLIFMGAAVRSRLRKPTGHSVPT